MHLSTQEILNVLKAAKRRSSRDHAMVLLAYRHGLRASEVCGLRLDDVDLKNGSIVIRRLKNSLQTTQPLCEHAGQPLLNEMLALRSYLRDRGNGDGRRTCSCRKRVAGSTAVRSTGHLMASRNRLGSNQLSVIRTS